MKQWVGPLRFLLTIGWYMVLSLIIPTGIVEEEKGEETEEELEKGKEVKKEATELAKAAGAQAVEAK